MLSFPAFRKTKQNKTLSLAWQTQTRVAAHLKPCPARSMAARNILTPTLHFKVSASKLKWLHQHISFLISACSALPCQFSECRCAVFRSRPAVGWLWGIRWRKLWWCEASFQSAVPCTGYRTGMSVTNILSSWRGPQRTVEETNL